MTTAAIDVDLLNELFDNQKKLDDVFNSMFDDDSFLSSPASAKSSSRQAKQYDEDFSLSAQNSLGANKTNNITHVVLPVALEIAIISYCIMYFNWYSIMDYNSRLPFNWIVSNNILLQIRAVHPL